MDPSDNPYAAPAESPFQPAGSLVEAELAENWGLWRDGKLLVMHKAARLPDRCVKSNVRTTRRLRRKLYWHHPAIYLTILVSLLIYIVLALIFRRSATIDVGLSDLWFRRRRRAILVGWILGLSGLAAFIWGAIQSDTDDRYLWLILVGLGALLVGLLYGALVARIVWAAKIDATFVRLRGVDRAYLDELPELPKGK